MPLTITLPPGPIAAGALLCVTITGATGGLGEVRVGVDAKPLEPIEEIQDLGNGTFIVCTKVPEGADTILLVATEPGPSGGFVMVDAGVQ